LKFIEALGLSLCFILGVGSFLLFTGILFILAVCLWVAGPMYFFGVVLLIVLWFALAIFLWLSPKPLKSFEDSTVFFDDGTKSWRKKPDDGKKGADA